MALEEEEPSWVAGFKLPHPLSYHPGHLWVHWVSPDQAYVGIDDFGRRLVGADATYALPWVGTHVGQGEGSIRVARNGDPIELCSPVAGEVIAVNPRIKNDPGLPFRDPYGRGWLMKVRSPRLFKDLSNLLSGSLARHWMIDTEERFRHRLVLASGSVIQDGGAPVENVTVDLSGAAVSQTQTAADGTYSFANLLPGDYTVTDGMLWFPSTWSAPALGDHPSPIRIRYTAGYDGEAIDTGGVASARIANSAGIRPVVTGRKSPAPKRSARSSSTTLPSSCST